MKSPLCKTLQKNFLPDEADFQMYRPLVIRELAEISLVHIVGGKTTKAALKGRKIGDAQLRGAE